MPTSKKMQYIPLVTKKAINKDTEEWGILKDKSIPENNKKNLIPGTNIEYNSIFIKDDRKVSLASGNAIRPNKDLKSGEYNKAIIENIVDASLKHGVDPYYALSTGLQETGLGNSDDNIGHVIGSGWSDKIPEGVSQEEAMVMAIKIKQEEAKKLGLKNEYDIIQHYNGRHEKGLHKDTEKGYYGKSNQSYYGVPLPINTKTNPVYGRQIVDLRDNVLKKNNDIVNIVNSRTKDFNLNKDSEKIGVVFNKYIPTTVNRKQKLPFTN